MTPTQRPPLGTRALSGPGGRSGSGEKTGRSDLSDETRERGEDLGIGGVYLLCPVLICLILKLMKTLDPPFELKEKIIILRRIQKINFINVLQMYRCVNMSSLRCVECPVINFN